MHLLLKTDVVFIRSPSQVSGLKTFCLNPCLLQLHMLMTSYCNLSLGKLLFVSGVKLVPSVLQFCSNHPREKYITTNTNWTFIGLNLPYLKGILRRNKTKTINKFQ